ncbi:MAG: hypothetical protein GY841_10095 [FCB group bacterium]|nr:hypothetical protein [FCB group bacterium]
MLNRMFCCLVIMLVIAAAGTSRAEDPLEPDTIIVETVTCDAGETVIVPINFFNDEELAALTIPLTWDSPDVILDSISFSWYSRVRYIKTKPDSIDNANRTIVTGAVVVMEAFVQPGTGLFGELYFSVPPGTPDQIVNIDTVTVPPAAYLLLAKANGTTFFPQFVAGKILIGDPPLPAHIELSPPLMTFEGVTGFPNPSAQTLTIDNGGELPLEWTSSWSSGWLSVSPSSGTAKSYSSIRPDISGLSDGLYYDTLIISCPDADNSPQLFPITLEVSTLPPEIKYSPSNFIISAVLGAGNPDDRYLQVWTDVTGSELNWTVSNSSGWLTLSPASGSPPDSVALQFDLTGLPFGIHYDTIMISDPDATNSPKYVPVTLQIVSDLPVLDIPDTVHVIVETGTTVSPTVFTVANSGEGVLTFSATEASALITDITPSSGTAPEDISVSFKTYPLSPGNYYDSLLITSPEAINSPQYIVTHLFVADDPPQLYAGPPEIEFNYFECWQGIEPDSVWNTLQIHNLGTGFMLWNLSFNSDWLRASQMSGINSVAVNLTLDPNLDLPLGQYVDTITVTADFAQQSPRQVVVTLNIVPGTETPVMVINELKVDMTAQEVFGAVQDNLIAVVMVRNQHPGCMDFWFEEEIPWLVFDEDVPWMPYVDSIGQSVEVPVARIDIGSYTYGTYTDSLFIHSSSASNAPIKVDVSLSVWRLRGDYDWSNAINVGDIVHAINYVFKGGPGPMPELYVGDVNCDNQVNVADIVYLIDYVLKNGDPPCGNPGTF